MSSSAKMLNRWISKGRYVSVPAEVERKRRVNIKKGAFASQWRPWTWCLDGLPAGRWSIRSFPLSVSIPDSAHTGAGGLLQWLSRFCEFGFQRLISFPCMSITKWKGIETRFECVWGLTLLSYAEWKCLQKGILWYYLDKLWLLQSSHSFYDKNAKYYEK